MGLGLLAAAAPGLHRLCADDCVRLTDATLRALAGSCKLMQARSISAIPGFHVLVWVLPPCIPFRHMAARLHGATACEGLAGVCLCPSWTLHLGDDDMAGVCRRCRCADVPN